MIVRLTWERVGTGFRAWPVSRPDVSVCSDRWAEIETLLFDVVQSELARGEWTADWSPAPPLPETFPGRLITNAVILDAVGRVAVLSDPATLYSEGLCAECWGPLGQRTGLPAHVHVETRGDLLLGEFCEPDGGLFCTPRLLEALPKGAREGVEFRPCHVTPTGRRTVEILEVLPVRTIPLVIATGIPTSGWECGTCRRRSWSQRVAVQSFDFIPSSDVPPADIAFYIRTLDQPELCVPSAWWTQFRESAAGRRLVASPLYSLEEDQIDDRPSLRSRAEDRRPATPKRILMRRQHYAQLHGLTLPDAVQ
jgi:hypothetical protein